MFTILVAEDDRAINTMIRTKLKQESFTVYSVTNGEEALSIMEEYRIDLLISDIMMPDMDGYQLVKALRETNQTLPILMVTAKSQLEALEAAFKLGVDDYMVKPLIRRAGIKSPSLIAPIKIRGGKSLDLSSYPSRL